MGTIDYRREYTLARRCADGRIHQKLYRPVARGEGLGATLGGIQEGARLHLREIEIAPRYLVEPYSSHQFLKPGLLADGVEALFVRQPSHHRLMLPVRI